MQTNLANIQAFNDQVYSRPRDLGLAIGVNIIEGAFWAAGSVGRPVGSLLAFFLSKLTVTGNFILARKLRDILPPTPIKN